MVKKRISIILISFIVMFSGCSMINTAPSDQDLNTRQFMHEEEKFSVDEYKLDQISQVASLIGYTNEYIYVLHYDEEDTIISRINYIEKYSQNEIYRSKDKIIFSCYVSNDSLYIGEAENKGNSLLSVLKYIELNGSNNTYKQEEIFRSEYIKFPDINYSEDYMVINYVKDGAHIVEYMDYESKEFVEIYKSDFEVKEGGLYKGDIPLNANGTEQGIYFQVISLNDEKLDFEGTQMLYFYSFKTKKYVPKLELSDKITYSKGDEDRVVINNYSVDDPRVLTGKIVLFKENAIIDIPGTSPINSISNSLMKENRLLITSYRNIYVYDLEKQYVTSMEVARDSTEIRMFGDTFGLIESPNGKSPVFKIITYKKE